MTALDTQSRVALFEYLQRIGDDRLILGHRLSEWCGHGPILEEDIALANFALDFIGQASAFLKLAGVVEGRGRTDDDLAYLRTDIDFKNCCLVELPRGDFAFTIARQFIFDAFSVHFLDELTKSNFEELAAIAAKSLKEDRYHLRHSSQWILRLGDGTVESHERIQNALEDVWGYTCELFYQDEIDKLLISVKIAPDLSTLRTKWEKTVRDVLSSATLTVPSEDRYMFSGSRRGRHSEHLGHLLSEMQVLQRSIPGAQW